ncbi:hypothetical protein PT2222_60201 [Paraburkholderia tropica]
MRDVFAEILLRNLRVGAVGLDVGERLVDGRDQRRITLAQQHGRLIAGARRVGGHDLQLGVGLVLAEIEVRQRVVDRGVHAARGQQIDRLVEALHRHDIGAVRRGELAEIAGERIRRLLAFQIVEGMNRGVVVAHDQHRMRGDIRRRKVVLHLARVGDRHLVDDGVVPIHVETGDQSVPLAFDEFRLDAQTLRDGAGDVDIETRELARFVVVRERRVSAFGADAEHAGRLHLGQFVGGERGRGGDRRKECGEQDGADSFHGGNSRVNAAE